MANKETSRRKKALGEVSRDKYRIACEGFRMILNAMLNLQAENAGDKDDGVIAGAQTIREFIKSCETANIDFPRVAATVAKAITKELSPLAMKQVVTAVRKATIVPDGDRYDDIVDHHVHRDPLLLMRDGYNVTVLLGRDPAPEIPQLEATGTCPITGCRLARRRRIEYDPLRLNPDVHYRQPLAFPNLEA